MIKAHVISHTHWDREWYKPYEHFRTRLIFFMDELINILEKNENFKTFMFDGQTIVLEDYLSVKPENYEKLKELIKDKRIIIGPWYVQPDEFAPDGESLVRNLLISDRIAKRFGDNMKIGYLPDSFGQSCQMPQILKGFGINSAVMMRGVPFHEINENEFLWEGINGDSVLAVYLSEGYFNACFLPQDKNKADIRIDELEERLKKYAPTDNILIMNGIDHQWPQDYIPTYLEYLNSRKCVVNYKQNTLYEYVQSVVKSNKKFKKIKGEMITPEKSRTHTSIASTRMYQKQENRKVESLLERYVEPISTLAWLNGAEYPKELINKSWKYLIQNQAHDSICGCCTDEVHKQIDDRFMKANDIGTTLLKAYSRAVAQKIGENKFILIVFNNSMIKSKQLVNAEIICDNDNFILRDSQGKIVDYYIDKIEDINAASIGIWSSMSKVSEMKKKISFSFYVDFKCSFGYDYFEIEQYQKYKELSQNVYLQGNIIENNFFEIKINSNGSFNVLDKETSNYYKNLNVFEDCADAGDSYNFCPAADDKPVTSKNCRADIQIIKKSDIKIEAVIKNYLDVPLKLVDGKRALEKVRIPFETYLTIYSNIKRIDVKLKMNNKVYDHRIRVLFPTGVFSEYSYAETQFGTIKRPNKVYDEIWETNKWSEKPLPIYSQQKFVDVNDGKVGLAVLNKGLTEYEIYENIKNEKKESIIAVTLLRCIGYMGKRELKIRPGRASGIEMETKDAQCIGNYEFEYSIISHSGDIDSALIPSKAVEYAFPPVAVQNNIRLNNLDENFDLFEIKTLKKHIENQIQNKYLLNSNLLSFDNKNLLVSAVKKAEDDNSLIIRVYNSSSTDITNCEISIDIDKVSKISLVDLNEDKEFDVLKEVEKGIYSISNIRPYTAVTLKCFMD